MERIQTYAGTQFTSKEFWEDISIPEVIIALVTPDHQEMNVQVDVTWQKLKTITHSIIVHAQVSEEYIYFALMYTTDNTFPVLPIKHLANQYGEPTTPHKMEDGKKPSVSNPRVLFCLCVLQKATAYVDTKALYMRHQSQIYFIGIFAGILQHQKAN